MKILYLLTITLLLVQVSSRRLFAHTVARNMHQEDSDDKSQEQKNDLTVRAAIAEVFNTSNENNNKTTNKQFVTNPLANNIIIENRQQYSLQLKQRLDDNVTDYDPCPIEKPFFDGKQCINCQNLFNMDTKSCVTCPENTKYDKDSFKCSNITYLTNLEADNLLSNDRDFSDWDKLETRIMNTSPNSVEKCSIEKPFAKKGICISCSQDLPLFNLNTEECQKCEPFTKYNKQNRKCQREQKTISNSQTSIIPVPIIIRPQETSQKSNQTTQTISTSTEPVKVEVKSVESQPIISAKFVIDPSTYGLILDQPLSNYIQRTNLLKSEGYEQCPNSKPYFDGKQCIACSGLDSKFSVVTSKCTRCRQGSFYLYAERRCVPNP